MKRFAKQIAVGCALIVAATTLSSCLAAAAGAGGYLLHKEGYRIQSPVTKEE